MHASTYHAVCLYTELRSQNLKLKSLFLCYLAYYCLGTAELFGTS